MLWGQLDGVGREDLVLVEDEFLLVLHADGDGSFTEAQFASLPLGFTLPFDADLADVDEDGFPDLLLTGFLSGVGMRPGAPGGVFLGPTTTLFSLGEAGTANTFADVDGDGLVDLLWHQNTGLSVRLGLPGLSWEPAIVTPSASPFVASLTVADLDADGAPDVVLNEFTVGGLDVRRGLGNGRFVPDFVLSPAAAESPPVVADLDGDGPPELVTSLGGALSVVPNATYGPGSPFSDVGASLGGAAGHPLLVASGEDVPGAPFRFDVHHAVPGAAPRLFGSTEQIHAPFLGGVLVPAPQFVRFLPPADGAGDSALSGQWPLSASGLDFTVQAWTPDAGAPFGFAASTAVEIAIP